MEGKLKETKTEVVMVRVTPSVKSKLESTSARRDRTISWLVNTIIENHFKKK